MAGAVQHVYQFKITLKESSPPIWRRVQVPQHFSFADLHCVIQDAMGWGDGHLHQFEVMNSLTRSKVRIGKPGYDDGFGGMFDINEEKAKITNYFLAPKDKANYMYDFGDGWAHSIVLEKILPADPNTRYPVCVAGKRACPPEDCGGMSGYENLLEILADPNHAEYEDRIEELGDNFDPNKFDPKSVMFVSLMGLFPRRT